MAYTPQHLCPGENPPSPYSQLLANTMASWTTARTYGIPSSPQTITAVAASAYSPSVYGSQWQRFINAFAIELELLADAIDSNLHDRYLEYPGYTHNSLDIVYSYNMPSNSTVVLAVSANVAPQYLASGVDINGNPILDPNRVIGLSLLQADRLLDFYYGISQQVTFTTGVAASSQYVLPNRVGINEDGSSQIEWVTLNGVPTTAYTLAADQVTLSLTSLPGSGQNLTVHFTTYDVWYLLQEDLPVLYLRSNYFEVFVATSGIAPTSNGLANNAPTASVLTPLIHMVWNELDEIGLLLSKPRMLNENNKAYQQRLIDSTLYPQNQTLVGLRNALATELGGVHHFQWGPGPYSNFPAATAASPIVAVGSGLVYPDSILINRLGLPYYSVVTTATSGPLNISVPVLAPGQVWTSTVNLLATGGSVIPGQVPIKYTNGAPLSSQAVYDNINVTSIQSVFTAQTNIWYPGSLQVWKNGIALTPGVGFTELSSTVFSLAEPAQVGDQLQLGYMYDVSLDPPELAAQANFNTQLEPVYRISIGYQVDPVVSGSQLFAGWNGIPTGYDPAAIPAFATWTTTITVTNAGASSGTGFNIDVSLPPQIWFTGTLLYRSDNSQNMSVSYIDGTEIWVNNLTSPGFQSQLYNPDGSATNLLKALAAEIEAASPMEWDNLVLDRSIWRSMAEKYNNLGFLPNLMDPDFSTKLVAEQILYAGVLSNTGSSTQSNTNIIGQAAFGKFRISSDVNNNNLFIDFSSGGAGIGTTPDIRYPQFQSGIGDGNDLKLQILSASDIAAATASQSSIQQNELALANNVDLTFSIPSSAAGAWWVGIEPGYYYLNQERYYYFSQPIYLETTASTLSLPGYTTNTPVAAYLYTTSTGLIPMRRVYFHDSSGNYTITNTETVPGSAAILTYDNVNIISAYASDGNIYSLTAVPGSAELTVSPACTASLTVTYSLYNSFVIIENGALYPAGRITFDAAYSPGALVIYEGGNGVNVTGMPLHPYYNPRESGFVYLSADTYVPSDLTIRVDPASVAADGVSTFTVKATVTDSYGSGIASIPVTILVNFREGILSFNGTTDQFGVVTNRFTSTGSQQVVQIYATVQLYDTNANPISSLIDSTYVEQYSPFT